MKDASQWQKALLRILIGITNPTIDRILKMENPSDCRALYTFYAYTRKWQKNNAVYATSDYAMKAMTWGRERFAKAKSQLKEAGFIEDIQRKDAGGKVIGWYVGVKFAQNATMGKISLLLMFKKTTLRFYHRVVPTECG